MSTVTEFTKATLSMDVSRTLLNLMFISALFYSTALTLGNNISLLRMEFASTSAVSLTVFKDVLRRVYGGNLMDPC